LALKRFLDLFVSLAILFFLSPIFAIIGFLIKIDSTGPVFYAQKRMGERGRIFKFYKFRSMAINSEQIKSNLLAKNEVKDGIIFKIREDPRITTVGRILRRYSIDELPQLINVIKGEMSLVGPRPFPVDESNKIGYRHIPRLNIKPGVTGLAQIKGRSDLTFKQWMRWDNWYLNNWSLGFDIKILFWTIPAILKGRGAY
jgi:lipopolysaccharide/colanic/teichoic acid biosynthesis glycosyltransferase